MALQDVCGFRGSWEFEYPGCSVNVGLSGYPAGNWREPLQLYVPPQPRTGLSRASLSVPCPFTQSHGTTTLGFVFQGGVIAAADTRASCGGLIACPVAQKVIPIHSHLVVTTSGSGADCMLWERILAKEIRLYQLRHGRRLSVYGAAKLLSVMLHPFKGTDVCVAATLCGWDASDKKNRQKKDGKVLDPTMTYAGSRKTEEISVKLKENSAKGTKEQIKDSAKSLDQLKEDSTKRSKDQLKEDSTKSTKEKLKDSGKEDSAKRTKDQLKEDSIKRKKDQLKEDSTKSLEKLKEDSTKSSKDQIKEDSAKITKDQLKEDSAKSTKDQLKEDSAKSTKDQLKEDSAKSTKDQLKEDSAKSTKDQLKEDSAKSTKDQLKEDLTKSTKDQLKEDSAKCTKDQLKEDSAKCTKDQLKEDSTKCTKDQLKEDSTKCTKDQLKEDSTKEDSAKSTKDQLKEDSRGSSDQRSGPRVCYVCSDGLVLKSDLVSVGSGSPFAYAVLDQGWSWSLSLEQAVTLAREAVFRATHRDAYSGNNLDLFHITEEGWSQRGREDLKEEYYRKRRKAEMTDD